MEKTDIIRQEKENSRTADSIMDERLKTSTIPTRLFSKVKAVVDQDKYISENGVFDSKAFSEAFETEASDWEKQFEDIGPIQGSTTTVKTESSPEDDKTVFFINLSPVFLAKISRLTSWMALLYVAPPMIPR